jgi:hypothetical protein
LRLEARNVRSHVLRWRELTLRTEMVDEAAQSRRRARVSRIVLS